jgi:S1-C subfamily serine protease
VSVQRLGREGNGSGFVVSPDGEVLTNSHVVRAADAITVVLDNGDAYAASIVGIDPTTDLALLAIEPKPDSPLQVLPLGESSLVRVGEPAIVIGSPFGFEQSLSAGYVSALSRTIRSDDAYGAEIDGVLQTDAAVNPGNSGGPLLNQRGEIIGVASAIYSTGQGFEGIGFAVPVDVVKGVLPQLRAQGFVTRPYLGVLGIDITPAHAGGLKLPSKKGVLVQTVEEGSAAELAGLKGGERMKRTPFGAIAIGGDILLAIDGAPVDSMAEISRVVHGRMIGESVALTVLRKGERMELRGRLSAHPAPEGWDVEDVVAVEAARDGGSGLELIR